MYGTMPDILISILRWILTMAGTWIVAKGWISSDVSNQVMGGVVTIVSQLFSVYFHMASNGAIPVKSTVPNAAPVFEDATKLLNVS